MLALAGDRDAQCPPAAARETLEALGSTKRKLVVAGPESGMADHYGHFDLLIGRRAPQEVFPLIHEWLEGSESVHDVPSPAPAPEAPRPHPKP